MNRIWMYFMNLFFVQNIAGERYWGEYVQEAGEGTLFNRRFPDLRKQLTLKHRSGSKITLHFSTKDFHQFKLDHIHYGDLGKQVDFLSNKHLNTWLPSFTLT